MFLMQPCPTITDNFALQTIGQLKSSIPQFNQTRNIIRKFSNTQQLIQYVQNGEVIMQYKIKFDEYLKSHVDLMKTYVGTNTNCQFKYNGFFTTNSIDTTLLQPKQQWGFQILMVRYIFSSVYLGGSLQSIGKLFEETANSYLVGYASTPEFTKNLQITFKYFYQSYDPLRRLYGVIDSVGQLFSQQTIKRYPQANPQMFKIFSQLLQSNLAYLKLQKYRVLSEYKSCKQGAWAVYERMKDVRLKLNKLNMQNTYQIAPELSNFINLSIVFYKAYALNSFLLENEQRKLQEEYGFIKKQFQQMINQNLVLADEILKLNTICKKLPGQQQDNVIFAVKILDIMAKHAQSVKYKFQINLHETKAQKPSIDQVVSRIQIKNIWDTLSQF